MHRAVERRNTIPNLANVLLRADRAKLSLKATDGIAKLGAGAESESVQLRAWRAILADQMAVSKFSDLEQRMVEIEERLNDRTGHTDHVG